MKHIKISTSATFQQPYKSFAISQSKKKGIKPGFPFALTDHVHFLNNSSNNLVKM